MVNDGANTTRQPTEDGGRRSPSPAPRRPRRVGPPPPSKPSPATSSAVLPPPSTPSEGTVAGTASSSSLTATRKKKSVICPICKKDMCHEKALCGHIRWHTQAERQAAYSDIARALASNFISGGVQIEQQGSPKRIKLPDLNQPPPPDDDDDGA